MRENPPPYSGIDFQREGEPSVGEQSVDFPSRVAGSGYASNNNQFGSALAHNPSWSPTGEDYAAVNLPKVGFRLQVESRLKRKAKAPFDQLPVSFLRPVPSIPQAAIHNFRPIVHQPDSKWDIIGRGFKLKYNGRLLAPLDVSAADYARFLEDIVTAGRLSGVEQLISNLAPLSMHMGATGYFVTKGINKAFARRGEPLVIETIETWQERFFGPRGIDAFVVYGDERITAAYIGGVPEPLPVDWRSGPDTSKSEGNFDTYQSSDRDSDSDSGSDDDRCKLSKEQRKMKKKQRKQQHKELKLRRKLDRKQQREERKDKRKKSLLLVLSSTYLNR